MITLKTLPQATAQEVFDQVANHLLTQNTHSKQVDGPMCLYRSKSEKDGSTLKCAAGCLIADDEYLTIFEAVNWSDVVKDNPKIVPDTHSDLIRSLQIVHDSHVPSRWKNRLKLVADCYKLNTDVLNNY